MKFSSIARLPLLTVFLGLLLTSANGQAVSLLQGPELRTKIEKRLDDWHKSSNFPGASVGICFAEGQCEFFVVGYADRKTKRPLSVEDLMLSGSVGKTFAAAVALQLLGKGKIDLDRKVEEYFEGQPWYPRLPNSKDITVRQLMNHTSGLVRYEFKSEFINDLLAEPDKDWKPEELVSYLIDTEAPFEAGKGWDYSDTNYILLGMIIEKVTGRKYYDLVKERLLRPFNLKHTKPQVTRKIKGLVQGYAGEGNPFGGKDEMISDGKLVFNPQFEWTGGGMVTNAADLSKWAKLLYEGRAFPKEQLGEMLKGVDAPMLGRESKYGLGVIIRPTPYGVSYGHSGFFPGYLTDIMYFPDHQISVAVQVNTSVQKDLGKPLGRVAMELAGEMIQHRAR